ncbi:MULTISPECIES: TRAP transporter substrate-binding protein [unclassified Lentilitoribacter]|jgi:TRAP-type mannitol/chloroaromatic compound transport system substrate-binding protein|uniref:TRAP transporter substrate-binding protein n=1 Tax=unclassified Lentilitoribacter TaxID=2647570 RepID=UPI0013A6DABE|nr:TRAP transporter substrate-binding protein [Lentilitoribacter sp. Alg239-R112]
MTDLNRRNFIAKGAVVTAGAGAAVLATPAIAQDKIELRMATSWPKNFPGLGTAASRFAERVGKATDGRITIKVLAAGELVKALGVHDAVQEGAADLYHSAEYYYQGKAKGLAFFSAVPMGLTADEMNGWIYHGGGQQIWDDISAPFNIKPLACGNTGSQMGGWFKNPITSLDDFKGLKMRMPGLGGDVLKELGATPVTLSGSEILPALQAGTIDATEWVGPWNDLAFGFYKVVKNYHYPGFHEPGTLLSVGFNKGKWDAMSASDRAIIEYCAMAENVYDLAEYTANNSGALKTLVEEHGVNLVEFPDEVYKKVAEVTPDIIAKVAATDADTKKVADSFNDFLGKARSWSGISDGAYMNKRNING